MCIQDKEISLIIFDTKLSELFKLCVYRIRKFVDQLKVVSRRNKTVRKAFVSYRPAVRRIYYDATNVTSGTEKPNYKG